MDGVTFMLLTKLDQLVLTTRVRFSETISQSVRIACLVFEDQCRGLCKAD